MTTEEKNLTKAAVLEHYHPDFTISDEPQDGFFDLFYFEKETKTKLLDPFLQTLISNTLQTIGGDNADEGANELPFEIETNTNLADPFLENLISNALQTIGGGNAEKVEVDSIKDELYATEGAHDLPEEEFEIETKTNLVDPFLQNLISNALQTIGGGNAEMVEVESIKDELYATEGANDLREEDFEIETKTNLVDPFLQNLISNALQTIRGDNADEGVIESRVKSTTIINNSAKLVSPPTAREMALRRYRRKRKARILGLNKTKKYHRRKAFAAKRRRRGGKFVSHTRFVNPWFD